MQVVGLSSRGSAVAQTYNGQLATLRKIVLQLPAEYHIIAILEDSSKRFIDEIISGPSYRTADRFLALVVPWREPPRCGSRCDGDVSEFLVSRQLLSEVLDYTEDRAMLAFTIAKVFVDELRERDRVEVLQVGRRQSRVSPHPELGTETGICTIVPHRGSVDFLRKALVSIRCQSHAATSVKIGLDDFPQNSYAELLREFRGFDFYATIPNGVGPYAIRQDLIEASTDHVFALLDSDDISCSNRFELALGHLRSTDVHLLGCHELRLNEIDKRLAVFRYPLDVHTSIEQDSHGGILHGTIMGFRRAFLASGGFSTNRKIANDTQFRLRAYFHLRMENLDEFLYIRRSHGASLTNATETRLGSRLRENLRDRWIRDFHEVRAGRLDLEHSSLMAEKSKARSTICRLSIDGLTGENNGILDNARRI